MVQHQQQPTGDGRYQLLPPLAVDEYAALKADIANRGVLVPIELDEHGNVLDGHHRLRACQELGIDQYPTVIRAGWSEDEKRTHVRALNLNRRHLSQEQRRALIAEQLRETPELSNRQIAAGLGVSDKTVGAERERLVSIAEIPQSPTVMTADGRSYPSSRPFRPSVHEDKSDQGDSEETEHVARFDWATNADGEERLVLRPVAGSAAQPAALLPSPSVPMDETTGVDTARRFQALIDSGVMPAPYVEESKEEKALTRILQFAFLNRLDPQAVAAAADTAQLTNYIQSIDGSMRWLGQVRAALSEMAQRPALRAVK